MPLSPVETDLLSPADAAKILGLSADMVRVLARDGVLRTAAQSVRGIRLFRLTDVTQLAAARAGLPVHDHAVQFYEDEEFLTAIAGRFLAEGLRIGAPIVVIATRPHRDAFARSLQEQGFDVPAVKASGQFVQLDAQDMLDHLMVDGAPNEQRFRAHVGGVIEMARGVRPRARVRICGEMVDLLWRAGERAAAIQLEAMWNDLAETHPFSLMCAHAMGDFAIESDAGEFENICDAHTRVGPTEGYRHDEAVDRKQREVARLQQRALALESEIEHRAKAEHELQLREEELRAQNERLAEAVRAKDEFLAMLGHELRNPLAPIIHALELIRVRGKSTSEHVIIDRQVKHLARLVDDLLDVAGLVRGKAEMRRQLVELCEIASRGIELASAVIGERRDDLEMHVPVSGLVVEVDPDRMAQVVANLLTNAAKYSAPGSRILVEAVAAGDSVSLTVRDDGVGIAPDMIGRIFDLFTQEQQGLDRSRGGLGLGLTIVKNIVELHGGSVAARSEGKGKGAELTVTLPAVSPALSAVAPVTDVHDIPRTSRSRRILLVEDNEDAAVVLAELLSDLGHQVQVAHDGPSALAIVPTFAPDLALLDVGLPGMNGHELCVRLREILGTKVRLVALTGYGDRADRRQSEAAGFDAHVVKPVGVDDLVQLVDESPG